LDNAHLHDKDSFTSVTWSHIFMRIFSCKLKILMKWNMLRNGSKIELTCFFSEISLTGMLICLNYGYKDDTIFTYDPFEHHFICQQGSWILGGIESTQMAVRWSNTSWKPWVSLDQCNSHFKSATKSKMDTWGWNLKALCKLCSHLQSDLLELPLTFKGIGPHFFGNGDQYRSPDTKFFRKVTSIY
jgi:hypothetical protein